MNKDTLTTEHDMHLQVMKAAAREKEIRMVLSHTLYMCPNSRFARHLFLLCHSLHHSDISINQ